MRLSTAEREEIRRILAGYLEHEQTQRMKGYIQHGAITTWDHCQRVTETSYWLSRRLPGMRTIDREALIVGAFLHDFYLYDWHGQSMKNCMHGFTHPVRAKENAERIFHIDEKTGGIIRSHMWPLTFIHPPTCREGWLVTIADKYCSAEETLFLRK